MKSVSVVSLLFSILLAACSGPSHVQTTTATTTVSAGVSYQAFYDELGPYGRWIDYPGYGYVWMPAAAGFRPYATNGYWAYTSMGWTWVSNYSWGWAPFHYGRWFYEDGYGWMWLPGSEWAPAWVSWRTGGGMYGWAPLGPQVRVGVSFSWYDPPPAYWSFVPNQYVANHNLNNYYINETKNVTIVKNTTIINNNYYGAGNPSMGSGGNGQQGAYRAGPEKNEVEKITHATITPLAVREGNKSAGTQESNGQLMVYRPKVNAAADGVKKPVPAKVETLRQVKPVAAKERQQPAGMVPPVVAPQKMQEQRVPATTSKPVTQPGPAAKANMNRRNGGAEVVPAHNTRRSAVQPMPPATQGKGNKNREAKEKGKRREE